LQIGCTGVVIAIAVVRLWIEGGMISSSTLFAAMAQTDCGHAAAAVTLNAIGLN